MWWKVPWTMRSSAGYAMLSSEVSHRLWTESLNRRMGEATIEHAGRSVQWPTVDHAVQRRVRMGLRESGRWDRNWVDEPLGEIVDRIQESAGAI